MTDNPKESIGSRKPSFAQIPAPALAEFALAMVEGARKYGRHNWRAAPVRASVYYDAALRHLLKYWEGEDADPETGVPHLAYAMACCAIIRDAARMGTLIDDRPPASPAGWFGEIQSGFDRLREMFPDPLPPVTRGDMEGGANG